MHHILGTEEQEEAEKSVQVNGWFTHHQLFATRMCFSVAWKWYSATDLEEEGFAFDTGHSYRYGGSLKGKLVKFRRNRNMRFSRAMAIHVSVFWVMTLCSNAVGDQHFGGPCYFCLHPEEPRRPRLEFQQLHIPTSIDWHIVVHTYNRFLDNLLVLY